MPHTFETQPIEVERHYTGLITQRNKLAIPIRIMGRRIIELYDALLGGNDAEITVRSTIARRAGYIPFNSTPVAGVPLKWFSFEPNAQAGVIYPMLDTTTNIWTVPAGVGAAAPTNIFTKPTTTQSSFFAVGNYLYIGNSGFSKKWDSGAPQGLTNWGISSGSVSGSVGPTGTGLGTDVSYPGSGGTWANPNNITANDGSFATITLSPPGTPGNVSDVCGSGTDAGGGAVAWTNPGNIALSGVSAQALLAGAGTLSNFLYASNFGFAIPSNATIVGIVATFQRKADTGGELFTPHWFLVKGGSQVGSDHGPSVFWGTSFQAEGGGGSPTDLWGTTWTPSDINNSSFGFQVQVEQGTIGSATAFIEGLSPSITVYYSVPSGASVISDYLEATTFGFNLPVQDVITGFLVEVKGFQSQAANATLNAIMLKGGTPTGVSESFPLPLANAFIPFGGSADLWGTTWLPNDTNQTNFGVALTATNTGGSNVNFSVDFVRITVFFSGGPAVTVNSSAGSFSATQGYQYLQVYGNSNDANISNPTPPSITTGPFSNKLNVQVQLVASADPQVNQIRLFRITDTGTGQVFFELPTSPYPNTSATVNDSAPDVNLVVTNAVQVGSLAYSPPPAGMRLMAWYAGRMWGAVGNLLYFSAGPDNYPMGNGNSNWPPANVFELPSTIVKLLPISGGNGMLVATLSKIHVVQGITNPGFTVNVWLGDVGARQENAIDSDGSNIYIFTSDRQFLQISSAGDNELTQTVSDVTDNFDPRIVYVCQHRSGSQDSRVFLSDGTSRILPYNLMSGCWEPIQTPVDGGGVGAIGSIEISPGIFKFLKGGIGSSQPLLQRDQNTFTDNGVQYGWGSLYGNIPIADPTQLANVDSLTLRMTNAGNLPKVQILPNEIAPTASVPFVTLPDPVDEPPEAAVPPSSYRAKKYYLSKGTAWTQFTHVQIQFLFGPSSAMEEILSWGLFPNQSADEQVQPVPQVQGR